MLSRADRLALLRRHGHHAQAQATLQPGLRYVDVGDRGYVAYARALGRDVVLGDPVCAVDDLDDVLEAALLRLRRPVFFQTTAPVMQRLQARGFYGTPIGAEPVVDLRSWTLRGRRKQTLRTAVNRARAAHITVVEAPLSSAHRDVDGALQAWRQTRRRRRLGFLVPPLDMPRADTGARLFCARGDDDGVLGFVLFDALHQQGRVAGYTPSVSCASQRFRPGLWHALMSKALETFQREGVDVVNLGLAPLVPVPAAPSTSQALLLLLRLLRRGGGFFYNFRGIERVKGRFGGTVRTAWLCHRERVPVWALLGLLRLVLRAPARPDDDEDDDDDDDDAVPPLRVLMAPITPPHGRAAPAGAPPTFHAKRD